MKIFCITHKPLPALINSLYEPLQVNAQKNGTIDKISFTDAKLDNISNKNDNFCELTGSYWLWKNYKTDSFIGLCHYRRYFNFYYNKLSINPSVQKRITTIDFAKHKSSKVTSEVQTKLIEKDLQKYDAIMPFRRKMKVSIKEDYCNNHRKSDWEVTMNIILDKFPEYNISITNYLERNNKFYQCNMIITSKKIWDDYHNWLFEILFELEKKITMPEDNYQKRVFGFLSERLLNLYVLHHNLKIKKYPLLFVND